MIANTIRLIHPLTIREVALANANHRKHQGQATRYLPRSPNPVQEGLGHHLVYVVVVAVLDARADAPSLRGPQAVADPALPEGGHAR
jgi:hypothetical protein